MISSDTTQSFLAEFETLCKEDPSHTLRLLANFCKLEPNFSAFLVMLHGKPLEGITPSQAPNPVSVGLLSAVLYYSMRESQDVADKLRRGISDEDQ